MIPTTSGTTLQPVFSLNDHQPSSSLAAITGSDHWKIERVIGVLMLAIISTSFVFNSVFMNYLLAASIAIHAHWGLFCRNIFLIIILNFLCIGMHTVLTDYCPKKAFPLANIIRYVLTIIAFAGLW